MIAQKRNIDLTHRAAPGKGGCGPHKIETAMKTITCIALVLVSASTLRTGPPSWNDSAPKEAIISFVGKVMKEGSLDFVPAVVSSKRIS